MARDGARPKDKNERLLVLVVDIDNDLYKKVKIGGPLIGRVQNLNGATSLAIADPEDSDSNAIFKAVNIYDNLKEEGYTVNVATVTGSESEGYEADREISRQLDQILNEFKSDACIFVTDGASDNRVLPIIESRIKVNSIQPVVVKQAEKLENTYFVAMEKLKEPHYARIVFGIPSILILLFSLGYFFGATWAFPLALVGVGIYLFLKGFGLEDAFFNSFRGFGFSLDRMSFVFYLGTLIFLVAGVFVGYGSYVSQLNVNSNQFLAVAYGIEGFMLLLPFVLILYLIGRIIDVRGSRYIFRSFKYGVYIGSSIIFWVFVYAVISWIIGQIYFSQFMEYTILAIVIGVAVTALTNTLRRRVLRSKRIKDKTVVNELGALLGKVAGLDIKRGRVIIDTSFGNSIAYNVDRIVDISDKVVIK